MSSKAIAAATTHFLQFRLQYSSLAFLYYDYALTFPKEVKYIWGQKFRLSTALYFGCRYALIANVLYLLAIAHELGSTVRGYLCDVWYKIVGALSVIGRAAVIAVFTMRTYAVYGKNPWILAYMGVVGLACVALDITHVPGLRCVGSSSLPIAPEMLSILMVIFESSSAFLTLVRSLVAFKTGGMADQRRSILFVMFEQGILYFCTISIFTTAAVILNYRAPAGFFQRLPNAFTLPLSCLLTARFILYLRKWDEDQLAGSGSNKGPSARGDDVGEISETEFRVAGRSRSVISTIISVNDFGVDPVVSARASHANTTAVESKSNVDSREEEGKWGSAGGSNSEFEQGSVSSGMKTVVRFQNMSVEEV
ncbi:hypothetical protein FB45DRAFT_874457 [Roridomyces roridus]|uniref:DUF6533 domain-containing protein n=1 Tax=Roridomyces roridus TaxID=1738132 RepID=A0AAD7FB87_9AGAR|nr:hypothetical protein FB45DRAFT_874457 [Roridomyces roridus]